MAETAHPEAPRAEGSSQAPYSAEASKGTAEKDTTPVYEVGFHIIPTVGEEGVPKVLDKVRALLGESEIIAEGFPKKTTLAYRVERATAGKREKYTESYFGWVKFAALREGIPALERALLDMPEVLRSLIIETVREDITQQPRRAVFVSDRLEGETISAPKRAKEVPAEVSDAELDKSIDALVQ